MRSAIIACTLILAGCVTPEPALNPSDIYQAQIPIAAFDGHRPYDQTGVREVDSYVAFRSDGVLAASWGCNIYYASSYGFDDQSRLILREVADGIAISAPVRDCDSSLIKIETALWTFLNDKPLALGWVENSTILKSGRKTLIMQSVADVLGDGVNMKENL